MRGEAAVDEDESQRLGTGNTSFSSLRGESLGDGLDVVVSYGLAKFSKCCCSWVAHACLTESRLLIPVYGDSIYPPGRSSGSIKSLFFLLASRLVDVFWPCPLQSKSI